MSSLIVWAIPKPLSKLGHGLAIICLYVTSMQLHTFTLIQILVQLIPTSKEAPAQNDGQYILLASLWAWPNDKQLCAPTRKKILLNI